MDKFGLLWVKIFIMLYHEIDYRLFSFDMFYVSTFWKALCPFFRDNIYEM